MNRKEAGSKNDLRYPTRLAPVPYHTAGVFLPDDVSGILVGWRVVKKQCRDAASRHLAFQADVGEFL